jgi:membrane protein YdbS with pleckstrin-like domain
MEPAQVFALERPHPNLLKQYAIQALLTGPFSPLLLLVFYFRFHSMRYRFDEHGVTKSHGILMRREVHLTYSRIQDIHLSSGPIQRWLGLADLQVQTASGSAGAELVIEGLLEFEGVRDFLYAKMRGIRPQDEVPAAHAAAPVGSEGEVVALLHEIRDDLRATREAIAQAGTPHD